MPSIIARFVAPLALVWTACAYAGPVASTAVDLRLCPSALAASGVNATAAADLLGRLASESQTRTELGAAEQLAASIAGEVASLADQVRGRPGDQQLRTDLADRQSALAAAQAAAAQGRAALREAASDELSTEQAAALDRCHEAGAHRVPPHWRVMDRSAESWEQLESAFIQERRAQRRGEELDTGTAQLLASVRADSTVVAAGVALEQNLTGVQQVFAEY